MKLSGGDKLNQYLNDLGKKLGSKQTLQVGFLPKATYPDGTSVAMVAAIQEFGAPAKGIPPRPFFRTMIAKDSPKWGAAFASLLESNGYDAKASINKMGAGIAQRLRSSIIETTSPPLSPVTLLLRQRFGNNPQDITFADVQEARRDIALGVTPNVTGTQAKPLEWTSHMLNSVDFVVKDGGT